MKNKSDNNSAENYMYINNNLYGVNDLLYHINRAGSGLVNSDFYIERNSSYPYSVIHYVIEGSGQVVCRGKRYPVKNGQCFILNSYEGHSILIATLDKNSRLSSLQD